MIPETEGFAEIIPGTPAATGGWLDVAARPISWLPPAERGVLPVQGYMLRDGGSWLVADTGLAVHWPLVAEGIRRTLGDTPERRLITTRREQDCMMNLSAILRELGVREVLYAGVLNPLGFFEGVEERDAAARIEATPGLRATRIAPAAATAIGRLRLEVPRVELRRLAANWSRNACMAPIETPGGTDAEPSPVLGRTAANGRAHVQRWSHRPVGLRPRVNRRRHTRPFRPTRAPSCWHHSVRRLPGRAARMASSASESPFLRTPPARRGPPWGART